MKNRLLCLVIAVLTVSAFAVFAGGAQGGEKEKVEISYWNNMGWAENRMVAFNGLVDRFMAEHPDIGVVQEMVSYPEMFTKTVPALKYQLHVGIQKRVTEAFVRRELDFKEMRSPQHSKD